MSDNNDRDNFMSEAFKALADIWEIQDLLSEVLVNVRQLRHDLKEQGDQIAYAESEAA